MKKEVAEQTTTATIPCREPTIPSHRCAETYPLLVGSMNAKSELETAIRVDAAEDQCIRVCEWKHTGVNVCMYNVGMYL